MIFLLNYYNRSEITFFARSKGTYTATVTIKDKNGKKKCAKKIKIYATNDSYPFASRYKTSYADYISDYYISYFAKKAGKAVVSFDVYCDGKFVQTCSISVIAKGYKFYKPVIKNVKYAGKELYYYDPFTNKTSGKLKVTPAKGYKIVSIEYSTGLNAKTGDYTYKKIKNNGKIKLLKQRKYTRKYNEGTEYESQYAYNSLFSR